MQQLLRRADWNIAGVRDDVRDCVTEHLGDADGVLIVDEAGFLHEGPPLGGVHPTDQERSWTRPLPGRILARLVRPHHPVHACPGLAGRGENPDHKRRSGVSEHGMNALGSPATSTAGTLALWNPSR